MKIIIVNKRKPLIVVERTNSNDIKIIHLASGIHATYHSSGHNHFFDPNSNKSWREEISNMGGHKGELISCTNSLPFSKISNPEFFIGISPQTREWKEKYKKINQLEINTGNVVSIFLSGEEDISYVTLLKEAHPYILIKF